MCRLCFWESRNLKPARRRRFRTLQVTTRSALKSTPSTLSRRKSVSGLSQGHVFRFFSHRHRRLRAIVWIGALRRRFLLRLLLPLIGKNFRHNQPIGLKCGDDNGLGGNTFSLVRLCRRDRCRVGFSAKSEQTLLGAWLFSLSAAPAGDRFLTKGAAGRTRLGDSRLFLKRRCFAGGVSLERENLRLYDKTPSMTQGLEAAVRISSR